MKTYNNNNSNETRNAAAMVASNNQQQNAAQKIDDFGQKIGGARKDLYAAAREWAEKLADITADQLAAVGVSKLVRLPNLESMTAAGAITAQQARAALVVWRSIEAKPAKSWRVSGWAERTRKKLDIIAALLTADNAADIAETLSEAPEYRILTAANWPAEAFTFGRYSVSEYQGRADYYGQSAARYFRIYSGRYSVGEKSGEAANIAAQLREMTARDAEKQAESRARGPKLGVYHTSDYTRYFIAVENKCEIVLKVCDTYQEAAESVKNERAELLARYEDLKNFPALRRSWNRPRVGKVWHTEDVTPDQFAAVLPFKGVEFGNWLNQQERAALLNSAFDGFHDLADLLGIPAEAVALGGRLNFSFATRGHAGSAAHFETAYNTINLNKRNGAGCMAHEWLHACDHYAAILAGRGAACSWGSAFATEYTGEPTTDADRAAAELVAVIRSMNYYTRSQNYQAISGKSQGGADYYTMPCELAARGFEGVMLYLLTKAGACSDFLVNLETWKDFEMNDKGHRRDCYPYPSDAEAAALLPYYTKFFRALFGRCEVSKEAAEGVAAATLQAAQEKAEADRRAAEKAEQERKESEERRAARRAELDRKTEEQRKENERKAAEVKAKAEATRTAIVERLTAAHFDTIATDCDSVAVYFAAHFYGEIYTGKADIKSEPAEVAAAVSAAPIACIQYKYIHNAKRIICRRWQVASIRSNKRTARELVESLQAGEVRQVVRTFADFEKAETWQAAAKLWADTQKLHEEHDRRHQEAAERAAVSEPNESKPVEGEAVSVAGNGPEGLQLVSIPEGVAVVGTADTEKARGRQTYRARREIKAHGAQWNHAANQWQATTPDSVARLREWFGVSETPAETVSESESEGTAPAVAPTLEQEGEITAADRLGEAVREWAANDYAATHHGATLTDWDKQHPAPVEWCKPEQVFKLGREIAGRDIYAIVTKLGGDCFFYVGNFGNNNEHLSAYNCQRWENLQPVEVLHEDTPKFAAMFAKFHSIREAWEAEGEKIWQEREDKERAAVVVPTLQQAEEITEPAATTLQEAGEISVKLCERIYNDTAAPVAIGDTVIYNKFVGETPHRAVFTGYDDTIKMYFLEIEDGQNIATGRDGFAFCGPESSTEEPAAIAASEEEGAPLTEPNRDGLPDWLHVGTRFCLLDYLTGKPTAVRYTCAAIDYEAKTVTIPEARDSFRNGSTVYRWDAFHWATFAPVTDEQPTTLQEVGEITAPAAVAASYDYAVNNTPQAVERMKHFESLERMEQAAQQGETGTAGRVKWARNAEVITTEEMGRVDVFEIVDEWPAGYYVWNIGREHFPLAGWLPLAKDGHNAESFQRNIDRDHLKAIKVQSEAAALACMDYAYHHDRPCRSDFLQVLAQYPTDPTPDPSGEGVGICHSYETGASCYSTSEKSENRREVTTLINGNGQPYKLEVPTVEIHGFTNSGGLAHIEENTGLHFEEVFKDSVYRAQPRTWEQVAALLLTYNWLTRYYNCVHRENVLVLRADCNTPAAATLYYKQDGRELVGIRGAY